jgi:uncharacterized membrane protein YqiK
LAGATAQEGREQMLGATLVIPGIVVVVIIILVVIWLLRRA